MNISKHAAERIQQRAINIQAIEILMQFGDEIQGGSKARIICVDSKSTRNEIKSAWKESNGSFDLRSVLSTYIVLSEDNCVITVAHKKIRFQKSRCTH